jgi:hypothetical protein
MGFAGGVQCAEWGLRRWDSRCETHRDSVNNITIGQSKEICKHLELIGWYVGWWLEDQYPTRGTLHKQILGLSAL